MSEIYATGGIVSPEFVRGIMEKHGHKQYKDGLTSRPKEETPAEAYDRAMGVVGKK
jgi:hypothetical protein